MPLRIGILASGNGTNLQAIIDAIENKQLDASIEIVLSDQPNAYALKRAEKHHLPFRLIERKNHPDKKSFEEEIVKNLQSKKVEWILLAGFMRLLSPFFIQKYSERILNIHPSLLPAFSGKEAIKQAYEYPVKITGCTIHLVDEGCDTGPIIAQEAVCIENDDTLESLTEKVHEREHQLYIKVLQWISDNRVEIRGRKVLIK